MADTGRQSPLGVNVLGSVLQNTGLNINPVAAGYMGASKTNNTYTFGSVINNTCLRLLTWAINDGYERGIPGGGNTLLVSTYNNLITIGEGVCEALGNSRPPTYVPIDPAGVWARTSLDSTTPSTAELYGLQNGNPDALPGPATSGYGNYANGIGDPLQGYGVIDQKQNATWYPYTGDDTENPNTGITKWGWVRCHALQAWNEFNWNGTLVEQDPVEYKEFLGSFMTSYGFVSDSNRTINVIDNSDTFLDGVYSNMNDLTSADIAGISLSGIDFGSDLENLGKVIDLKRIETFGMPSNLLMTIGKAGAMTPDLGLALLASGLSKEEISALTSGIMPNWSKTLEQNILGAFLIITGENLANVLAPLQCRTQGLDTLADLLNLQKLFPNSYASLTVPVYNSSLGLPTNSKTYYLIYENGGLNQSLNSQEIQEYVGTIIPRGIPPIYADTNSPENFIELPKGFGSYLDGIIPFDWATAAGAFSYSMRQVNNLENVNFEVFAKVAKGIENLADLPLTTGTSKPTDQAATDDSKRICSLGSGYVGTYTMSDLFGCMSGLPYPWKLIQTRINQLETSSLYDTYRELFLAVTWEQAELIVQYSSYEVNEGTEEDPIMVTYYHVTGITISNPGGGYTRGGAPDPIVTLSNGGTAIAVAGTNDMDPGSVGQGSFGRVIQATLVDPGPDLTTIPTITIEAPPTSQYGGTNTPYLTTGWTSPMNSVVQGYIDDANTEIQNIAGSSGITYLNQYWNILGTQLAREQRARYTAMQPVSVPKDYFANPYPNTSYTFLDSVPVLSQETRPHMSAQTIEAITDMDTIGGQSLVGKMREERNQARLRKLGVDLDNNISDSLAPVVERTLLANGTVPGAIADSGIASPNGNEYTLPAWPANEQTMGISAENPNGTGTELIQPEPAGYYVPLEILQQLQLQEQERLQPGTGTGETLVIQQLVQELLQPNDTGEFLIGFLPTSATNEGDITPILDGDPNPVVNPLVPSGPVDIDTSPIDEIVIIGPADEYNPANLPPNLDPNFTSSTLMPATLSIKDAIDKVIECNCDCWIQ